MNSNQKDMLEMIVSGYTYEQQREIFVEECAEAVKAVQKVKRAAVKSPGAFNKAVDELVSEVADVLITAEQMRLYLGEDRIDKAIDRKLKRQLQRMRDEL